MDTIYQILLHSQFIAAIIVFLSLFFVSAPYGRFIRSGWGPNIKTLYAWIIQELPVVLFIAFYFFSGDTSNLVLIIFFLIWQSHYLHRTFMYPFGLKSKNRPYPLILVLMAVVFNCMNGFINGYGIFRFAPDYELSWLTDWRFILGFIIFITGYFINKQSDSILGKLRKPGETGYKIPTQGLYNWVSCPNYLGEIMEWGGWALLTWSLPGLAFFVFTIANLFPRAVAHHRWYTEQFPDYPKGRKIILPYIL